MGVSISERKVGDALQNICPSAKAERYVQTGRQFKPKVYKADYFGHKMNIDQNKKLAMCGVTHDVAREGYSRMISGCTTVSIKKN